MHHPRRAELLIRSGCSPLVDARCLPALRHPCRVRTLRRPSRRAGPGPSA